MAGFLEARFLDAFFLGDRFLAGFFLVAFFFVAFFLGDRFLAAFLAVFLFFAIGYGSFPESARIMLIVFPLGATNRGQTSIATKDSRQPRQKADRGDHRHKYPWTAQRLEGVFLRVWDVSRYGALCLLGAH
jgi:hypothetical protein